MNLSHLVDVFGTPRCGAAVLENVAIDEVDLDNPDVGDSLEVCPACLEIVRKAHL